MPEGILIGLWSGSSQDHKVRSRLSYFKINVCPFYQEMFYLFIYSLLLDKLFFFFSLYNLWRLLSLLDNRDTEKPPTPSMSVCCRIGACCGTRHPRPSHTSQWDTLCCVYYAAVVKPPHWEHLLAPTSTSWLGQLAGKGRIKQWIKMILSQTHRWTLC